MPAFSKISDLDENSRELLEAAGLSDLKALAQADPQALTAELERANRMLSLAPKSPEQKQITAWIQTARELTGSPIETPAEDPSGPERIDDDPVSEPVNHEANPEVQAMLERAPFAIPLPARHLIDHHLAVADIPPALLLNRYSGDLECRIANEPKKAPAARSVTSQYVQSSEATPARAALDLSQFKPMATDELPTRSRSATSRAPSSKLDSANQNRIAELRTPREETNRGRNPSSRRYIRGVLHSHPWSMRFAAAITLLLFAWVPFALTAAFLLLMSDLQPETFAWVQPWWLVFPVALPLIGIGYLIWGTSGKCRICGQRLFVPKACRKNSKAHHVRGVGYIIPLSFHLLLFHWFRCTHCGTPVRLRK